MNYELAQVSSFIIYHQSVYNSYLLPPVQTRLIASLLLHHLQALSYHRHPITS
jgi:hypothetical protein